jgi:hypothetical protein
MKKRFQKLAVATAVTAAMAGVTLPAQAIVTGIAGEALLVPLTIWDENRNGEDLNTLIEIEVPASVGWEAVAHGWMAPHTTPINPLVDPEKYSPDAFKSVEGAGPKVASIHWFVFDKYSAHKKNDVIKVTPNDVVQINFADLMGGALEGIPTYMVFVNESSYAFPEKGATFPCLATPGWLMKPGICRLRSPCCRCPMDPTPPSGQYMRTMWFIRKVYPLPLPSPAAIC